MSMTGRLWSPLITALCLLAFASGCSDSTSRGTPTIDTPQSSPDAVASVGQNAVGTDPAMAQTPPPPTTSFEPHTDRDGRYTVRVPSGWMLQESTNSLSATLAPTSSAVPASAQAGIYCLPNSSVDQLISVDQNVTRQAGLGDLTLDDERATEVAGTPAREIHWTGDFRGLQLDHVFVYFEGHGCAWRIQLTTYPGLSIDAMRPVLDEMLRSFTFT